MELTKEQVAKICTEFGFTLNPSWDGFSEDVPVTYPNPLQPWCSCAATVSLKQIVALESREEAHARVDAAE